MASREMAELIRRLGIEAYRSRLIDNALRYLGESVELDPANAEAHGGYGLALLRKYALTSDKTFLEKSITHLRAFTELAPDDSRNYLFYAQIGDACDKLGRPEEAGHAFSTALELNPNLPVPEHLRRKYLPNKFS